jgi:hypothetical protein
MLNLSGKGFIFFILILLSSPALSLTGILGLGFFPNEKIAILLVALSKHSWDPKYRQLRLFGFVCAFILTLMFFLQIITNNSGLARASINSIIIIASIPLYFSFFSQHSQTVMKCLFYIGTIQCLISLTQVYFSINGNQEMVAFFKNYPENDYFYSASEAGFWYRTSGLFYESSGYGVFQWITIISGLKIGIHKKVFGKILLLIMFAEVILNGSLTGYFFALGFFGIDFLKQFRNKKKAIKLFLAIPFIILSLYFLEANNYYDISGFTNKIVKQFDFLTNEYSYAPSRIKGMVHTINDAFTSDYIMFGSGFTWINPTLDFYSLYLKAYGIFGFITITLFLLALLRKAPLNYQVAVFLTLSINGHLSTVTNIILLSLPLVFFKMDKIIKRY